MTEEPNGKQELTEDAAMIRRDFTGTEITKRKETASTAMAAQAQAAVQARYVMALQRPRDWLTTRSRMMQACKRPGFCELARYSVPRAGTKIEGWSIRFAEEIIRSMGNILPESAIIYDDDKLRIIRVAVTDLENNIAYTKDVSIKKTMERRSVRGGQTVLATRTNSTGETVHIVQATDDELANKEGSAVSKAIRNAAIRLVPADILDDCMKQLRSTLNDRDAKDPNEAKKRLTDAFAELSVMPSDLKTYLGHEVGQCSPVQLEELREIYSGIKNGESSWADVMSAKEDAGTAKSAKQLTDSKAPPKTAEDLKAREKAKAPKIKVERDDGTMEDMPPAEHWEKMDKDK